ncbi:MAG: hypothetical protein Q8R91_05065 [Candidatus Omnitrophota bacterium]|nr:hypothetical protein [Candidatus Omnitrophota bacterium]
MRLILGIVVMSVGLWGGPAWAARTSVHDAAESTQYGRKAGGMIGRGLLNAATCFVDVIVNTVNGTKNGPPLVGTLTGIAKGTGCSVLRLGSGVVDVVTFWVPGFNGFPVSDSYEDCLAVGGSSVAAQAPLSSAEGESASMWEPQLPVAEPSATQAQASPTAQPQAGQEQLASQTTWKK